MLYHLQLHLQSGFRMAGVWPFNRHISTDHEFMSSAVTDRPLHVPTSLTPNKTASHANDILVNQTSTAAGSDHRADESLYFQSDTPQCSSSSSHFSPSGIRPFPVAAPRQTTKTGRKRRKAAIYTDTPIKAEPRKHSDEPRRGPTTGESNQIPSNPNLSACPTHARSQNNVNSENRD